MNSRFYSPLLALLVLLLVSMSSAVVWAQDPAHERVADAELDQLLAPVALYPDSVLSHLLIASTYPLEVVMAERWTRENPDQAGQEALNAVEDEDWDPSVKALVAFPDLLQRMSEDLDWTESLGEAFLADEERVLDRVQVLRQKAYDAGSLEDLEHLAVSRKERHIVIEPVVREVIYVPYYDTRVVYGSWWWADHPPHYWHHHYHHHHRYDHIRSIYWGPRVSISWHFFFSGFHWHQRRLLVVDHDYYWHHRHHHRFWRAEQVAHYRDARHWRHNPYHRRGVNYRNPRTRDYFERRHRERGDYQHRSQNVRSQLKQREHSLVPQQSRAARTINQSTAAPREQRLQRVAPDVSSKRPVVSNKRNHDGSGAVDSRSRAAAHAREHEAARGRVLRQTEQRAAPGRAVGREQIRRAPERHRSTGHSQRPHRSGKSSHLKAQ
jgi:hypothetical protein